MCLSLYAYEELFPRTPLTLNSLKKALDHVDKLKSQPSPAKAIDEIKCAALTCRYPLETFLAKIQKYEKSLGIGKTDGKMKDIGARACWALGRKEEKITKLRDDLKIHVAAINMMLVTRVLEQLDVTSIQTIKAHEELKHHFEQSSVELSKVKDDVQAQNLIAVTTTTMVLKVLEMISKEVITPITVLREMVAKI